MTAEPAHRPSSTRAVRRRGSRTRRRLIRSLLGAALAVAGVLVPLEAADLPDPLDALAADAAVLAQDQPVADGTAEPCPARYTASSDDASLCVLETSACPDAPAALGGGPLMPSVNYPETLAADMRRIGRYPDFCEARYLESADRALYGACRNTRGFVVRHHFRIPELDGEGNPVLDDRDRPVASNLCRILHPTICSVGAQIEPYTCRATRRRTWSCPAGYIPRNDFNTCFKPLSRPDGPHPACGPGAPELHILNCADYAANDYVASPGDAAWACGGDRFGTGSAATALKPNSANRHWCRFDTSHLQVACHRDTPPAGECTPTAALCLKRASRTGGCNAVANTIRCRILQAGFADGHSTPGDVRTAGCQPCILLPFEPRPATCPNEIDGEPAGPPKIYEDRYNGIHLVKVDFDEYVGRYEIIEGRRTRVNICEGAYSGRNLEACVAASRPCQDPPSGSLTWSSTHHSQFAVVNLPIILTVEDVPSELQEIVGYSESGGLGQGDSESYLTYPGEGSDDIIQRFRAPDTGAMPTRVGDLAIDSRPRVCRYGEPPVFRVVVEELSPDDDEQAIKDLFGERSLDWWNALDATERANLTAARGAGRTEEVPCNSGEVIWCRWTPTRSGYYTLTAAGAWLVGR
ncbi:MAG: hypothetical protein OXE75_03200, partial [bacterium]|nr:hypothetical protein [bacterium]